MSKLISKITATSNLCENKLIKIKPRMIILKALGGYTNNKQPEAKLTDETLAKFCLQNKFVIVPNNNGTLDFIHQDELPKLIKEFKQ